MRFLSHQDCFVVLFFVDFYRILLFQHNKNRKYSDIANLCQEALILPLSRTGKGLFKKSWIPILIQFGAEIEWFVTSETSDLSKIREEFVDNLSSHIGKIRIEIAPCH